MTRGRSSDRPPGIRWCPSRTFYTGKEHAPIFLPESLVHLPDRVSTVIRCKTADSGPLDLPDHIAVTLT